MRSCFHYNTINNTTSSSEFEVSLISELAGTNDVSNWCESTWHTKSDAHSQEEVVAIEDESNDITKNIKTPCQEIETFKIILSDFVTKEKVN